LLNIINDILDVAALKEGKLAIKHEAVDLEQAVAHVVDIVAPLAKKEVRGRQWAKPCFFGTHIVKDCRSHYTDSLTFPS
jgi:signal transduction histidine kinase